MSSRTWTETQLENPSELLKDKNSPMKKYVGASVEDTSGRKKKKTMANKDIRKDRYGYNEYIERCSILDQIPEDSPICQSPFKGILRLLLIVCFIYILNASFVRIKS